MLTLQCEIKIKSKSTNKIVLVDYVNSIEVKTSHKNLTDTAVVKYHERCVGLDLKLELNFLLDFFYKTTFFNLLYVNFLFLLS